MTSKKSILLIHPPVSKPCEPPAGLALLSGALTAAGIDCRVADSQSWSACSIFCMRLSSPQTHGPGGPPAV